MKRRDFILTSSAALASGCSTPMLLRSTAPHSDVSTRRVFAVTNRMVSSDPLRQFERERSDSLSYLAYDISIPSDRKIGEYSFPRTPLNPAKQFIVTGTQSFAEGRALAADINAERDGAPGTVLFVHGYNVSFPGAVFRTAQIATDFGFTNPISVFSWPSAGRVAHYAYDRDSVLYARRALAQTITLLAKQTGRLTILAHSMGGFLVMEALKRLAIAGATDVLSRINGTVLVQPDIDLDVFENQMKDIRDTGPGIAVIASRHDRALKISSVITGGHARVGDAENIEAVQQTGAAVFDISDTPREDALGHSTFLDSPELLQVLRTANLAERVVAGAPGQDILRDTLSVTGSAALAIGYLPYTVTGG